MNKLKKVHDNPLKETAEVLLNSGNDTEFSESTPIYAEVRFATDTYDLNNFSFEYGFRRARLYLQLHGCEMVPGSQSYDQTSPTISEKGSRSRLHQRSARGSLGAGGQLGPEGATGSVSAEGNIGREVSSNENEEVRFEREQNGVRYRPGGSWEFSDPLNLKNGAMIDPENCLDYTFLANAEICKVRQTSGANRCDAYGLLVTRRRDIVAKPEGTKTLKSMRNALHKERMISAIVSKCISIETGQYDEMLKRGSVVIGRSIISNGDD
ncbi:MAG: hypothetical protein AAGK02_06710 [Pseudomonadota bacterium]